MDKKRLTILVLVTALVVLAVFFLARKYQNSSQSTVENKPSQTLEVAENNSYAIRPDFSKVKDFKNTLTLQKGVSVKYGDGWVGKKMENPDNVVSGQLVKTIGGRSYMISMFDINNPTTDISDTKVYAIFDIKNKSHAIVVSSNSSTDGKHDYASVSACSERTQKDCSLTLDKNYLLMMLGQYVPNAQESVSLDFSRLDDQQILAEFAEIASTLNY